MTPYGIRVGSQLKECICEDGNIFCFVFASWAQYRIDESRFCIIVIRSRGIFVDHGDRYLGGSERGAGEI